VTSASVKLLRTQSDERLVALAAGGHERAFEAIVERYRRPLLRHCRRYLPEARAEDALQQALVSAWTALRRGDEVRELRPWLHRIVQNASLNALRVAGYDYEQLRETLEGGGGPAELAERSAVVRQALAGLAALPERQREALLQIAVEGRSQEEVAQELGLSHNAVRQLVHRARSRLRGAATALTPLPLANWLAAGGGEARGDVVARVAEMVAGAGGGATLAKAGAVATLAGGAIGAPVVVDEISDRPSARDRQAAITAPAREDRQRPAEGASEAVRAAPVVVAEAPQQPEQAAAAGGGGAGSSGRGGGEGRSGRSGDDSSGPGGGGGRRAHELSPGAGLGGGGHDADDADDDRSGPGGGEDDEGESGSRGRGGGSGKEERDDDDERVVPVRHDDAPEDDDDDEPERQEPVGSGSSGSGSSGKGPSGSGAPPSGSSGSGSPPSGSSGSGSSGKGPDPAVAPDQAAAADSDSDSDD
jgi:RNA polymerase sigma factor (sigma-70 family)